MTPALRKAALLDVNVPIALMDPAHEFHAAAHAWFQQNRQHGWATCPITEDGCLRILNRSFHEYAQVFPPAGVGVEKVSTRHAGGRAPRSATRANICETGYRGSLLL